MLRVSKSETRPNLGATDQSNVMTRLIHNTNRNKAQRNPSFMVQEHIMTIYIGITSYFDSLKNG